MSDEKSAEYQRVLAEEKEKLEAERRGAGLESTCESPRGRKERSGRLGLIRAL
jgi:hypothetical protein